MNSTSRLIATQLIAAFILSSCTGSYKVPRRNDLNDPDRLGSISVLTSSGDVYAFRKWSLTDSVLVGSATRFHGSKKESGSYRVPLADVTHVQANAPQAFSQVLKVAFVVTTVGIAAASLFETRRYLSINENIVYHSYSTGGTNSSCPHIYSWNGQTNILEGEGFGIALGKALEMNTVTVLRSIMPTEGTLKVRIANERPETDYVNSAELLCVETDSGVAVRADSEGRLWPVRNPAAACRAYDHSRRDATGLLSSADGLYWTSDLAGAGQRGGFEDTLDFVIARPRGMHEASFILHARNTNISAVVFDQLHSFLGDQALRFLYASENDSGIIAALRRWQKTASLRVYVFGATGWHEIGAVLPEATAVQFARLLRFKDDGVGDSLRVRICAMADVWMIDAAETDFGPAEPFKARSVPLLSAVSDAEPRAHVSLSTADEAYVTLLPGNRIDLAWKAGTASPGKRLCYALNLRGYLHEWIRTDASEAGTALAAVIPESARMEYVSSLLSDKRLLLPLVYKEWRERNLNR